MSLWSFAQATPSPLPSGSSSAGGLDWGWIPDVVAIVIAGLAALYARRANQIAQTAPAEARTLATRDLIRDALKDASDSFTEARAAHNVGNDIPPPPAAIGLAIATLERHNARLPERSELRSLLSNLRIAQMKWDAARRAESDLVESKKMKSFWEDLIARNINDKALANAQNGLANSEKSVSRLERLIITKRSDLIPALEKVEKQSRAYTDARDAADRTALEERRGSIFGSLNVTRKNKSAK